MKKRNYLCSLLCCLFFLNNIHAQTATIVFTGAGDDDNWENTAKALLAKIYLNQAVFSINDRSLGLFNFSITSMNKVIELADQIAASKEYHIQEGLEDYFNTFAQANDVETNSERILFPIPTSALLSNPHLVQNPGY